MRLVAVGPTRGAHLCRNNETARTVRPCPPNQSPAPDHNARFNPPTTTEHWLRREKFVPAIPVAKAALCWLPDIPGDHPDITRSRGIRFHFHPASPSCRPQIFLRQSAKDVSATARLPHACAWGAIACPQLLERVLVKTIDGAIPGATLRLDQLLRYVNKAPCPHPTRISRPASTSSYFSILQRSWPGGISARMSGNAMSILVDK